MTGSVTLYTGDCMHVLPRLKDTRVDLAFACLPAWMEKSLPAYDVLLLLSKIKPLRTVVLLPASRRDRIAFESYSTAPGVRFKCGHLEIGSKALSTQFLSARFRPLRAHEEILVLQDRPASAPYSPQLGRGKPYGPRGNHVRRSGHYRSTVSSQKENPEGTRRPRSLFPYPSARGDQSHANGQHQSLSLRYILTYTRTGDTVLDFTAGAGTTLLSAALAGRDAIGIEIDAARADVASTRLSAAGIHVDRPHGLN